MRLILRICLACVALIALALCGALAWVYFDTKGLPDLDRLAQYAPNAKQNVFDPCTNAVSTAIPYDLFGDNLRNAIRAAEGLKVERGALISTYLELVAPASDRASALSSMIARTAVCGEHRQLDREILELRLAAQLDRRFSRPQLFAIYANRLYLGEGVLGVDAAAQRIFHNEPHELSIAQAALLAGAIESPTRYSPDRHPGRALERRNAVIDAMVRVRELSVADAWAAKSSPLPTM